MHALWFSQFHSPGIRSSLAHFAARMVLFIWACFWLWFGLSSGLSAHLHPLAITLHVAAPAAVFALIAWLSLRHPRTVACILVGFAATILLEYNHLMGHRGALYVLQAGSIISGPPLLSALLFFLEDHSRAPIHTLPPA